MASLSPIRNQFFDNSGVLLTGGLIYTYQAGTTNPFPTYTDSSGTVANANPIVLNARGEADIWLNGSYKFVVCDSLGSQLYVVDNVSSTSGSGSSSGTTATGGGNDKTFLENDTTITTSYTLGSGAMQSGCVISIAVPGVVTFAGHGYVFGQQVHFTTTGALPTGLAVDTVYYVSSTGLTANAFQLSATYNGTSITTTGTQSGVHSVGKIKNAVSGGTVQIVDGVTLTIPTGAAWTVV